MPGPSVKPIYSSRGNDPSLSEVVDRFVVGLGDRIDELQDLETENGFERIGPLAHALEAEARNAGFDELADAARALEAASAAREAGDTRERLVALTALVHRVRLGHSGAA